MHVLHGLFVAGIGYVVLFAGLHLLRNRPDAPAPSVPRAGSSPATYLAAARPVTIATLAGMFWVLGAIVGHDEVAAVSLREPLDRLPRTLGAWAATAGASDPRVLAAWQGADERVLRRYRAADGRTLDLFVAYYGTQRQNRELTSYLTADLHRGASVRDVALPDGSHFQVNFVERIDGRPLPAMFWYELGESVETGQYTTKLHTMWRALSRRRTDGAVVVISSPYGSSPASLSGLQEFAALAYEALGASFPRADLAILTKSST
jgi:EpsI family protein